MPTRQFSINFQCHDINGKIHDALLNGAAGLLTFANYCTEDILRKKSKLQSRDRKNGAFFPSQVA